MRVLNKQEYKLFQELVKLNQFNLKLVLSKYLRSIYKEVIETPDYLCAKGDIPIALVAHMDTVFNSPPKNIFYDREKNVIWSPEGLGADDRAGVYAVWQILRSGARPHIIFTTDEESVGFGATALIQDFIEPFAPMKYIIQLDRRGANDCVFYDCITKGFEKYINSFGFTTAWGTFSDISIICPGWDIAGVNLSVGYVNEHSISECLYISHLFNTIEQVKIMLNKSNELKKYFKYEGNISSYNFWNNFYASPDEEDIIYSYPSFDLNYDFPSFGKYICNKCKKSFFNTDIFVVKGKNKSKLFYCINCIGDPHIAWCNKCGNPVKFDSPLDDEELEKFICEDCLANDNSFKA